MGYYDQDYSQERYQKQKGNRGGYLLASLLGVVLGAILVVVAFPAFMDQPSSNQASNDQNGMASAQGPVETRNLSVDVTTQVTEAVDKAGDAVVGITNIQANNFWDQASEAGTGSGVIYKVEDGRAFVVTNDHVISGADEVEVTLADGTKRQAEIRGSDVWTDLAVLEMDGEGIETVAEFGNSDNLQPGEPVIAIGNPLGLQFSGSVTQGVISGLERAIPVDINQDGQVDWQAEVLQTDAAINPGNSGGALVNIEGQVIGINSMKIAQSAVEGIGLSIPINYVEPIIQDLEQFGEVRRPTLGVTLQDLSMVTAYHQKETLKLPEDVTRGVVVFDIQPSSPAAAGGLEQLDVIVELDGQPIETFLDIRKYLYNEKDVGDEMTVSFYRAGELQEATVTLNNEGTL
ncbi:S1C family serine protease [Bacillus fonticola]|uniref:S1C family serine protease n=1 Tax=Bacillus fonticola TaxID=2728853 RepID=UPI00147425AA|nr:trypsin-like peptidase domain-containing protein [Bacillus fonticola]